MIPSKSGRARRSVAFVALTGAILLSSPATASAEDGGAGRGPDRANTQLAATIGDEVFTPGFQPADIWAACGISDDKHKLVRSFPKTGGPAGGEANLRCGSEGWGYRHIKIRHSSDWSNVAGKIGDDWRTFSDWAISKILKEPATVDYRQDNDTWTFKAPILIRDGKGNVVDTYNPRVSVANDSKNIITAFPER